MKNIKNIYKTLIYLLSVVTLGCEQVELGNNFLEEPPELSYSIDSVFANATRARELLWNAYSTLPYGLSYNVDLNGSGPNVAWKGGVGNKTFMTPLSDLTDLTRWNATWGPAIAWQQGTVNAMNIDNYGKYCWESKHGWDGIRKSFIFIDNVDRVPDMSDDEKKLLKAEAKLIIATHYVQMFRYYGGILFVNHAYSPNENFSLKRLTVLQSVDTLTTMIDETINVLPFELNDPEQWSGRLTSAAAMALKVKLLSFAAAPLLNNDQPYMQGQAASEHLVWTGGYKQELWIKLKDACKQLIDKIEASSYYKMENTGDPQMDYRRAYLNRSPEKLFGTRIAYQWVAGSRPDQPRNAHWLAIQVPLHNYAKMFPMKNGMSIDNPESGYDPQNPYYNRDPRLYESLVVNGGKWQGRKAELYEGGRERTQLRIVFSYTGYRYRKWYLDLAEYVGQIEEWPYVRIPEVYLSYAEALNELNSGPTDEAFKYVNKVRERVQVGPIENFVGKPKNEITKQEFLDAVLNERAIELGGEEVRWFDMARYKMVDAFTAKDKVMDIYLKEGIDPGTFNLNDVEFNEHDKYFDYVETEYPDKFRWQSEFDSKYFLEPFPFSEVQKGYGLIQNPGWEL